MFVCIFVGIYGCKECFVHAHLQQGTHYHWSVISPSLPCVLLCGTALYHYILLGVVKLTNKLNRLPFESSDEEVFQVRRNWHCMIMSAC